MKKIKHSLVITLCFCAAFLCGVYFEKSQKQSLIQKQSTPRVYLEQLKTKMNIRREGSVDIYLNGKKIEQDTLLDIKK